MSRSIAMLFHVSLDIDLDIAPLFSHNRVNILLAEFLCNCMNFLHCVYVGNLFLLDTALSRKPQTVFDEVVLSVNSTKRNEKVSRLSFEIIFVERE